MSRSPKPVDEAGFVAEDPGLWIREGHEPRRAVIA